MRESESPHTLSHEEAVAELDQVVSDIHTARRCCHSRLRQLLANGDVERAVDGVRAIVDEYGATLESHFNTMIELKVRYPAAWDASDGGRLQRAHDEALRQVVAESLPIVLGLHWPGRA